MNKFLDMLNESFDKYGIKEDFIEDELSMADVDDIPSWEDEEDDDILSDDPELVYHDEDIDFEVDDDIPDIEMFGITFDAEPEFEDDSLEESRKDLADKIRNNDLEYDDEIDAYFAKDGEDEIQFQDRETNSHKFGEVDGELRKLNKQPKTSSHTWARLWKNGELEKSIDDSKYVTRDEMIKYLENDSEEEVEESLNEVKSEDKYVDIDWL